MRLITSVPVRRFWNSDFTSNPFMDNESDFDNLLGRLFESASTSQFSAPCDIKETEEGYFLSFDVPGIKKENIQVQIEGDRLSVAGERQRHAEAANNQTFLRYERSHGKFEREFKLPSSIASDKVEAHHENGVLSLFLPKAETAKSRSVQIQSGTTGWFEKLVGSKKENTRDAKSVELN